MVSNSNEIEIIVEPPKKVVSFKLDVDIIEQIDRLWQSLGYRSRSEFLREAVLFYIQYLQRGGAVAGSLAEQNSPDQQDIGDIDLEELSRDIKSVVSNIAGLRG